MMKTYDPIKRVCFTFSMPEGLWVERQSGDREWLHSIHLTEEVGFVEAARLCKIAHHDGMCGMWYHAENGGNVYNRGVEVN